MTKTLPALLRKYKVKQLNILGDLTETKDRHSAWLVNKIADYLNNLSAYCPIVILCGNHDYLDPEYPFFRFVGHIPDVTWVNEPEIINGDLYLPHLSNGIDTWKPFLKEDHLNRYIFTHNTFTGAFGESGRKLTGIPLSVFNKADQVISGDVHKPQEFGPVTYVGAPYHIDFGDDYKPRVLVIRPHNIESVPVPGPRKVLVEVTHPAKLPVLKKGDLVKVQIHIEMKDCANWDRIRAKVREWAKEGMYKLHTTRPIVDYTPGPKGERSQRKVRSDEHLLRDYGNARDVDDRTLAVGLELCNDRERGQANARE